MTIVERDYHRDIVTIAGTIDLSPDIPNVVAATRDFVPGLTTSADLVPFRKGDGRADLYRAELRAKAPRVASLTDDVSRRFESGTMAAIVPFLGLEDQPLERQRYVLFALGNLLGTPTATEPRDERVLWDVKVRATPSGQFATFSETDDEAEFHADSAFTPDPEPIFFLYVVQAVRCAASAHEEKALSLVPSGWCRIRERSVAIDHLAHFGFSMPRLRHQPRWWRGDWHAEAVASDAQF